MATTYLFMITGLVVVSGLPVPAPPVAAMQAIGSPSSRPWSTAPLRWTMNPRWELRRLPRRTTCEHKPYAQSRGV